MDEPQAPRGARAGRRAQAIVHQEETGLGQVERPIHQLQSSFDTDDPAGAADAAAAAPQEPPPVRPSLGAIGGFMGPSFRKPEPEVPAGTPIAPPDAPRVNLAGISKRKEAQAAAAAAQQVKAKSKYEERALHAEILDIPELEEEGKEDLSRVVAAAPKVRTNRVQGISELDEDMHYMLPASEDKDVDLSMLTAVLCSAEQVEELDDIWTPEMLLVQLAAEMNSESEKAEGLAQSKLEAANGGAVAVK